MWCYSNKQLPVRKGHYHCSRILSEFDQKDQVIVHSVKRVNQFPGIKDVKRYLDHMQ